MDLGGTLTVHCPLIAAKRSTNVPKLTSETFAFGTAMKCDKGFSALTCREAKTVALQKKKNQ